MNVLELFKGGGSISKYWSQIHIENADNPNVNVISLDIDEKYNPTICCDIMDFDYKQYPVGYFDIIWASPECKIFSQLQYTHINTEKSKRKLKWNSKEELLEERKKHSKYINKTIEIIEYLKPSLYYIENPLSSSIWNYIENKDYLEHYVIVDYCRFGYDYQKPTKILTNNDLKNMRCECKKKHIRRVGINSDKELKVKHQRQWSDTSSLVERYSIPQPLLEYLFT